MRLSGHVDGISIQGTVARILDHKTGRKDSDYSQQALGYCALVLINHPELDEASCTVLWIRDQEIEQHSLTRSQLPEWLQRLRETVIEWSGQFRPGPHCTHCPRNIECPAANALVRRDVAAIANLDLEEAALASLTASQKLELVTTARAVAQLAERFCAAIKADVARNGDVVADGKRLTLQHEERKHLDVLKAFPVLEEHGLGDEEMAKVITLSLSKASDIVAKQAGKGNGAGAARRLHAALHEAEAIQVETVTKLVTRRV